MTPFQELRLWLRRAPATERVATALAVLLVLGTLLYLGAPESNSAKAAQAAISQGGGEVVTTPDGQVVTDPNAAVADPGATGSSGTGSTATTGTTTTGSSGAGLVTPGSTGAASTAPRGTSAASGKPGTVKSSTKGGTTAGSGSTSGSGGSSTASCPSGTGKGLTAKQIKIAIVLVQIVGPAGNSTFGVSTPAEQQKYLQTVIDDTNARGGVACRQLVPTYLTGNPIDENDLTAKCTTITNGDYFAAIDVGAYAQYPIIKCFADGKVPYFGSYFMSADVAKAGFPYLFNFNLLDNLYKDTIFGLKSRGFFSSANGFGKLGFAYRDCNPGTIKAIQGYFTEIGLKSSDVVEYNIGCPSALANPSDLQQAVLKFQQAGVTHVTTSQFVADYPNFTSIARNQGFKPQYGVANDSLIPLTYGSQSPDPDNFDGATAIVASRDGEERTPGQTRTAGTIRCDAIETKAGFKPTWEQVSSNGGNACDVVWMLSAAIDNAPSLRSDQLAAGLQAAKSVDFSWPQGPTDFSKAGVTTGGQFWRAAQYTKDCKCWKLLESDYHRTFV